MHKLNILIYGSDSFKSTLNELKPHLKFNITTNIQKLSDITFENFDGLIIKENIDDKFQKVLANTKNFKIFASSEDVKTKSFDYILKLPTTVKDLNNLVESGAARKEFSKNSSIKIKSYLLDKNEKKLLKDKNFIILTEKEIQLLELFLIKKKPIAKNEILSLVWRYASDADTHTVETHIYRLRKKINKEFSDVNFIQNNKLGYFL